MTTTAFLDAVGTNYRSYRMFMTQKGPDKGAGSNVYYNAFEFFYKRKMMGIKDTKKKRKVSSRDTGDGPAGDAGASGDAAGKGKKKGKKQSASDNPDTEFDVSSIILNGEDKDEVPVYGLFSPDSSCCLEQASMFVCLLACLCVCVCVCVVLSNVASADTCDEIRRKINAHLKKPSVTQASFCRHIAASFRKEARKIQGAQLTAFRSKGGPTSGNTSSVYYGSYVFFEKLRLKENKPKSKHRLDMECIYHKGVDIKQRDHGWYFARADEMPVMDKYGVVTISRMR